ncbi:hemolysin family protein [Phreatobacter sp. AB_2022a]|uniref:hemolysin family protein n=1 Tax=Phreatobacter sp. AB_2022a TaxID=3003134 RepID=UPI0022871EC0|nr:hemolysin family protein [Phreatobacter sp. AB_2022a]MCZ0733311.1 hemolysin family protein [Phreatobacter sp. AB_2022a]
MPDPSDSRYRSTAAEAATPLPPNSAPAETDRSAERHERWIDRLRLRLGLRANASIRRNLEEVLEEDAPAGAGFTPEERAMLKNILELRESGVGDLAQPRADIIAVQKDISLGALMQAFEDAGHTRLVVFDDTLDDPVGMVHIKDLVTHLFNEARTATRRRRAGRVVDAKADVEAGAKADNTPELDLGAVDLSVALSASRLIRPILFVPPSMPAIDLLARMQATRIQLALVVDEYGGTDGLIAMEDIVESIVGDIEDEHDVDDNRAIIPIGEGAYMADARATLEDVRETLGRDFDPGEEVSDEVDTLGGYLTVLAGHVPVRGEVVAGRDDFEFEVVDADPRRVKRVKITRGSGLIARPSRLARRKDEEEEIAPQVDGPAPAALEPAAATLPAQAVQAVPDPIPLPQSVSAPAPAADTRKAS